MCIMAIFGHKSMKKLADKKVKQQQPSFFSGARLHYVLISLLVLVLYANSFKNGYAIDDNLVTNNNALVKKGLAAIPEIFTTNYVSGAVNFEYRPLVKASYAIENQFFGTKPSLSHIINALLYALTGIVLYRFLRRCLTGQNAWLPLLATLIFIAHPVHTEVVDNLKSRDELFALLFSLLAATCLLKYAEDNTFKNLFAGLGLFTLALLSKASCLAFIGIAPLAMYYFRGNIKAAITAGLSMGALTGLFYIILTATLPAVGREILYIENPLVAEQSIGIHIASAFYWLSHYIRLLILPYPLAFYYGYSQMPITEFSNPLAILSLLLHAGLLGYAIWGLKTRNLLSFAAWVYLGGILLFANLLTPVVGIVGERFLYIGSIGFCIAIAYGIISLAKLNTLPQMPLKANTIALGLLALLLIPYSALTISRNTNWKDALTLFRHDVKVANNSAKVHGELAMELRRQFKRLPNGNPNRAKLAAEAAGHFDRSIRLYPKNNEYHNLLGSIYLFEEHNPAKALPELRLAVANSKNPRVKYLLDLANCYQAQEPRQLDSAEKYFLKVLDADSVHVQAHYQLAKNSYLKGDTTAAKNINRRFLKLHPDNPLPYRNQGDFYLIEGDTLKAREWYKKEKYYQDRLVTQPKQTDEE